MKDFETHSDATHLLSCRHCVGSNCRDYYMRCLFVKDMGDGRAKVIVFGDRYWQNTEHVRRVRYVPKWRLTEI